MQRTRLFIYFTILLMLFQPLVASEKAYEALPDFGIAIGEFFPIQHLVEPNGQGIGEAKILGKPLLVNFYTSYCSPCIKEVPKLNQIMQRRTDIKVLAITPDTQEEVVGYVKQHGFKWLIAANANELLSKQLRVDAFPAFALLDAKGRLVATVYANQLGGEDGHATVEGIEAWLDFNLSQRGNNNR